MTNQSLNTPQAGPIQAWIIVAISLLPMMAVVVLMPIIPAIFGNFKDIPNILTLAPLVVSAPGLCIALFSPYAGYLTDRLGRRNLLLIFTFLYGFGGVFPFFFNSFPVLMGGRLLLGIGEAFILTIGNTLLGDYFSESKRAKWLMWQGIVGSACGTMLLSLSGYLSTMGWQYPLLVYCFAIIISVGVYFFIFEPARKTEVEVEASTAIVSGGKFPTLIVVRIALTTLVAGILYFVYTLHFSMALDSMGIKDRQAIGNYSAIASIAVPIGALLFKLISNRSGAFQFACMFFLIGAGLIGIGLAKGINLTVAAAWVQQLGCGMLISTLIAWGLKQLAPEFRGRGMGFWTSGFFMGQFLSPLAVSGMRNITGSLLNAFVVFGIICVLIAAVNFYLSKKS